MAEVVNQDWRCLGGYGGCGRYDESVNTAGMMGLAGWRYPKSSSEH